MDAQGRLKAGIAINALVVVADIAAIAYGIAGRGAVENFSYYTQCANLLGAIACLACFVAEIRQLRGKPGPGMRITWLKYAASCCLAMTFVVVLVVLAPMLESIGQPGFYLMFVDGAKSITHLIAPLLVCGTYVFLEADRAMTLKESLVGFVPTLLYALVAYTCNGLRLWVGPYPFFQVWDMPIWMTALWFIVLCALALGLCQAVRLLGRKLRK